MRLLQLNPDGTEESALDFHPTITVVNGLGRRRPRCRHPRHHRHRQGPGPRHRRVGRGPRRAARPHPGHAVAARRAHRPRRVAPSDDLPLGRARAVPARGPDAAAVSASSSCTSRPPARIPSSTRSRRSQADAAEALAIPQRRRRAFDATTISRPRVRLERGARPRSTTPAPRWKRRWPVWTRHAAQEDMTAGRSRGASRRGRRPTSTQLRTDLERIERGSASSCRRSTPDRSRCCSTPSPIPTRSTSSRPSAPTSSPTSSYACRPR